MLRMELAGQRFNKAAHRRQILPLLPLRTEGSIEFKHQNISAVLVGAGEAWIRGYKPAYNYQISLEDAVLRWFERHPEWSLRPVGQTIERQKGVAAELPQGFAEADALYIGPPPTQSNQPPPMEWEQIQRTAKKFDVAARDARNRQLGKAGEAFVLAHEQQTLAQCGRRDLAQAVRWVSEEDGDGAGYDIASFTPEGAPRLIEVKTTHGWERTPFHITRNELAVSEVERDHWCLFRLWNFSREPRAFELYPPLEAHVRLTPTTFQAEFGS